MFFLSMQATVICALVYQKKASLKILSKIGLVIELYIYLCANVIKMNCCRPVQQHFFYTTEARVHSDMECVGRVVVVGGGGGNKWKS